nr:hypothetical protein [Verrucomicrobiota bacterium]
MRKLKQTSKTWLAAVAALTLSMTAAQAKFVCGNVSGTWSKADSPIIVTCDIIVPPGETLTIE